MTYVPIQYLIPACDIMWGVFTLLQFRVNSYAELAAYRFLIGWFEAAFFPAMHYVFGILKPLSAPSSQIILTVQALGTKATKLLVVVAFSILA